MDILRNGQPRAVITGLGAVTPLGIANELWNGVINGQSGIRKISTIPVEHVPVRIAGEVRDFDSLKYIDHKEARRMGRAPQFAIASAQMALADAGLTSDDLEALEDRACVIVGTSLGAHEMSEQSTYKYKISGYRKPNPLSLINSLPNMPAHYISRLFRAVGHLSTPSTACAAGTQAIGQAADLIRMGRADVVICGAVEAILQDYTLAGFDAMKALAAEYNDCPELASRPFDENRSGFVFSEGCGIVVLESLSHARRRDAHLYCEIMGYASSSDAYHVAALDPTAEGAIRSMRGALRDAHCSSDQIDYINAHGTSTQANDIMETVAIKQVLGEKAYNTPVSSTKSMLGHALAGSGAIEVVICAKALTQKIIPPTINLDTPGEGCDLDYVPHYAREYPGLRTVLSNSFGLGGQNATIILQSV